MPTYPTPAALPVSPAAIPGLAKLLSMARRRSFAAAFDAVRAPTVVALLIALLGAVGSWLKQPWLFAGIGPTVLLVASNPGHESARIRAIVLGHLAAMGCAYLALMLLDATRAPSFYKTTFMVYPRIWASALALAMMALVQPQFRAFHPPAGATALLVTMGAYRMTGKTPLALVGGVVVMAVAAEALHRFRPRRGR